MYVGSSELKETKEKPYRKFSKEVLFVGLAQLLPRLTGFVTFPLITKTLGAENYGIYSQILITIGLISPVALLGLSTALRTFLPGEKNKNKLKNDFWSVLLIIFINSLVLLGGLYLVSPYLIRHIFKTQDALFPLRVATILILLSTINQVLLEYFVIFGQAKRYTYLNYLKEFLAIGLIFYFFLLNRGGILALILISIFCTATSNLIAALIIIKHIGICIPIIKFSSLKPYFKLALPIFLSGYAIWFIHSGDRYVIGYFMDIKAVGVYSGIYNLSNLIMLISSPIHFVLLPTISRYWKNNEIDRVRRYVEYSVKCYFAIGIPAIFGMSILAKQLLKTLSTTDFVTSWFLVPIITSGILVLQGWYPAIYILLVAGRPNIILLFAILAGIENFVLNIIVIPVFGLKGAGVTTLITYITYIGLHLIYSRKYLIFNTAYGFIAKSTVASVIMSCFIFVLNLKGIGGLLISMLLGGLIYSTILFGIRAITLKELRFFWGKG